MISLFVGLISIFVLPSPLDSLSGFASRSGNEASRPAFAALVEFNVVWEIVDDC